MPTAAGPATASPAPAADAVPGGPIERYVGRLDRRLVGPRRAKTDLLAEARDSLVDAAEARLDRAAGPGREFDREAAEARAVAEFGPVDTIAPGYQTELALAQARRTLLLLVGVLLPQPIVWAEGRWPWNSHDSASYDGTGPVRALDLAVEGVGAVALVGTLVALAVCGVGLRWPPVRRYAARATSVFVLAATGSITVMGAALTLAAYPDPVAGLLWLLLFVAGPFGIAAAAARRCLRLG